MITTLLAQGVRLFTGAQARWVGCVPDPRQRIYFANHTSHLDLVLLWAALPTPIRRRTRPVAARDYWEKGKIRRIMAENHFRAILIDRSNITKSNNPMGPLLAALAAGDSLIVFPEGSRGPGPEVGEFKGGLYHLAKSQPEVECVPVYIENLNRVMPKGEFLPIPILCSVCFGAPLHPLPEEGKPEFLKRAREAVVRLNRA